MTTDNFHLVTLIIIVVAAIVVVFLFNKISRLKNQLNTIIVALDDVQKGNGNRRVLAKSNDLVAPLAYKINEVISGYEEKLSTLRQNEEINKHLMTSLSHDVRTPLTTLIGYLDAVKKGTVTGIERENYLETARRKAYNLKDYTDILFDWFKLNSNDLTFTIEPLEIAELTRNILIDWIPIFEEKGIHYEIEIPEERFVSEIDIDGYTRAINNLVQNVVAHSKSTQIKIAIIGKASNLEISIADNGIGIPQKDLPNVFERLYKCDKARSEKGSGLGLSIVRQLLENMNGTISVKSETNRYTIFTIRLPIFD